MRFHEIHVIKKKKKRFHIRILYELKKRIEYSRYRCNLQKNKYIRVSYYNIK